MGRAARFGRQPEVCAIRHLDAGAELDMGVEVGRF
jgi:hypothetical protein